jgi:hypothetical protein
VTTRSGFLKSRVYAKLVTDLISKRYQTFKGNFAAIEERDPDSEACKLGKQMNLWAVPEGAGQAGVSELPPDKADLLWIWQWKF